MAIQRWLRAFLVTASLTSAHTPVAPDPPQFAHVSGIVVDERNGRLLRRVMVCLHRGADTGYSGSTTEHCNETDVQGRFDIASLPPARYTYSLQREGYLASDPITDEMPPLFALNTGDDLSGAWGLSRDASYSRTESLSL